ncbi:MAG: hypothetical protein JWR10_1017 [Rubritepida sp.]|nr:hypothetical protein [Rubritepida sp.]
MLKAKTVLALVAAIGLGACATQPQEPMHALLDATGTPVYWVPASTVQNTPPGTAIRLAVGGTDTLVTLGPRVDPGTSAGLPVVMTTDAGRPIITRIGPGSGDLAPAGTPVITGSQNGRPVVEYQNPPTRRRAAPVTQ